MLLKNYVLPDLNDPTKLKVEYRSSARGTIGIAPVDPLTGEFEDAEWLQVENIENEQGQFIDTITVNQLLKDEIKLARQAKKVTDDEEKVSSDASQDQLFDFLLNFDENDINNIEDIRSAIGQIKNYFLFKYKSEVKKRKNK